jgi:GT2 family glycosyltransferase
MRVYSDEASSVGQVLDLELLIGEESSVRCTVEVAWVSQLADGAPAKYDVGLKFLHLPPGFLHRLAALSGADPSKLLTVVPTYRQPAETIDALSTVWAELGNGDDARILVVDDDSRDDSLGRIEGAVIERGWSDRVSLMSTGGHGGFGLSVNAAIRRGIPDWGPPDFIYLLDPAATPDPHAVHALTDVLLGFSDVGIVGSRVHDTHGATVASAFPFPSILSESFAAASGTHLIQAGPRRGNTKPLERTGPVDWVTRTSMMVRREVFDAIGLFDETLRYDFVEVDFCRRADRAGWSTFFVHQSGVTLGPPPADIESTIDRQMWLASRQHYIKKTSGAPRSWLADLSLGVSLAVGAPFHRASGALLADLTRSVFRTRPATPRPPRAVLEDEGPSDT